MARNKLEVLLLLKDKLSPGIGKAKKSLTGLESAANSLGTALGAYTAVEIFKTAGKMIELGVETDRARTALEAYAGSSMEATRAIELVKDATGGALSEMDAMQNTTRMLSMGLAQNADEAAKLTDIAVTLGATMGKGPQQALNEFTLMLANQSILRLDTFGISGAKVRERMEELAKQGIAPADRQMRFLIATMEEAEKKMGKLDKAGFKATSSLDRFKSIIEDSKKGISEWLADGIMPIIDGIFGLTDAIEEQHERLLYGNITYQEFQSTLEDMHPALQLFMQDLIGLSEEEWNSTRAAKEFTEAVAEAASPVERVGKEVKSLTEQLGAMGAESTSAIEQMISSFEDAMTDMEAGGPQIRSNIEKIQQAVVDEKLTPEQGEEMVAQLWVAYEKNVAKIEGRSVNFWNMKKAISEGMHTPLATADEYLREIWKYDGKTITTTVHTKYIETITGGTSHQHGGPLRGGLAKVGEAGWEYIWNGVVIPHHMSKQLERLGMGKTRGFQVGGELTGLIGSRPRTAVPGSAAAWESIGGGPGTAHIMSAIIASGGGGGVSTTQAAAAVATQAAEVAVEKAVVGAIQPEVTQQTIAMTSQMQATRLETLETNKLLRQVVALLGDMPTTDEQRQIALESEDTSGW